MPRFFLRAPARLLAIALASASLAACSSNPEPELEPDSPVRIAPPDKPVAQGDCAEALRRAAQKQDLYVDQLPTPKARESSAIPVKQMPEAVRKARYSEVKASVLIDTLGRADMKTFTVIKSTHPWLASSVKSAVAKWKFEPAQLAGCKVPRLYNYNVHAGTAPKA
jgi:hypothetical protein